MSNLADDELTALSLNGNRQALEELVVRYQPWIYNIAFRMVLVREDAEDVAQEIVIKMLTKLSTYDPGKASFRTWLYRIVANHVINMKTRGFEKAVLSFKAYHSAIAEVPDESPQSIPDSELLVQDIMIGCVLGMMLCLERRQRLAFILGVVFGVRDAVGGEVMGITRANFRQLLSRARKALFDHMHGYCGVLNQAAPCRCRNKAKGFMQRGYHAPDRITFVDAGAPSVAHVLPAADPDRRSKILNRMDQFDRSIYSEYVELFRSHPFYTSPDLTGWLRKTLERQDFKEMFQLKN